MIGSVIWWLLKRALGNGVTMTDEVYAGILEAIAEDAAAWNL